MRGSAIGTYLDFDDVPEGERAYSPDRARMAAVYVFRRHDDGEIDTTDYHVVVWDVASKQEHLLLCRSLVDNRLQRTLEGKAVRDAKLATPGEVRIEFADGSVESARVPDTPRSAAPELKSEADFVFDPNAD